MGEGYVGKIGYILFEVAMVYRNQIEEVMSQIGTTRSHGVIICEVGAQEGISQTELADKLKVRTASMTYNIKQLEELGWIHRERDAEDQRLVRVYLTEIGKQIEPQIIRVWNSLEDKLLADMPTEKREQFSALLQHILHNIKDEKP
jgi:MarR family transcriptional regulator, organic hydroperoxide resistance regulator